MQLFKKKKLILLFYYDNLEQRLKLIDCIVSEIESKKYCNNVIMGGYICIRPKISCS